MSLSKKELLDLLEKASVLIDTVIQALPDPDDDDYEDNEDDYDDVSPLDYLMNAAGDIQEAINGLSGD
tara:strand:- start:1462 stop:1665 length:204 start_codon:yes stop_codon:yes gene_type:complete